MGCSVAVPQVRRGNIDWRVGITMGIYGGGTGVGGGVLDLDGTQVGGRILVALRRWGGGW